MSCALLENRLQNSRNLDPETAILVRTKHFAVNNSFKLFFKFKVLENGIAKYFLSLLLKDKKCLSFRGKILLKKETKILLVVQNFNIALKKAV